MSTYLNEKAIEQLKNGEWEYLSRRIIVRKNDDSITIEGPGVVQQIGQKYFRIIIFSDESNNQNMNTIMKNLLASNNKAGEIIANAEFYELVTCDEGWKARNLCAPNIDCPNGVYVFMSNEIYSETTNNSRGKEVSVKFTSFHEYSGYPTNNTLRTSKYTEKDGKGQSGSYRCVADTEVLEYDLRIIAFDGETNYSLKTTERLCDINIENRVIEALEFVLGKPFEWNIKRVLTQDKKRLHIRLIENRISSQEKKPYAIYKVCKDSEFEMFWNLYSKFLAYILKDDTEGFSKIGGMLRNLACLRSSRHILSAYALSLSVAIEELISGYFVEERPDEQRNTIIKKLIEQVDAFLKDQAIESKLIDTIKSHIGKLKKNREYPKATLQRLIDEKKLLERRVDSWGCIRHKIAHGKQLEITQDNICQVGDLETLLFRLIFLIINYNGLYNDYGELGYPLLKNEAAFSLKDQAD